MALITDNNGEYFGYYFDENFYRFREVEENVSVETGPLLRHGVTTVTVATAQLAKYPIPLSHSWSTRFSVQWLLQEGYVPFLKGANIKLYPPFNVKAERAASDGPPPSSSSIASTSCASPTIQKRFLARAYHFVDHAINHYRLIILRKSETIPEHVTCPITTELMREPIVDQPAIPFEKSAHRTWMTQRPTCPLNRETLTSPLQPNYALRDAVALIWNSTPIPVLPVMIGKSFTQNDTIVETLLQAARQASENKEHVKAIQLMESAFPHTGKSEDYELLPQQYIALNDSEKAILACLYLGKRKLVERKQEQAAFWFQEALKQSPRRASHCR